MIYTNVLLLDTFNILQHSKILIIMCLHDQVTLVSTRNKILLVYLLYRANLSLFSQTYQLDARKLFLTVTFIHFQE